MLTFRALARPLFFAAACFVVSLPAAAQYGSRMFPVSAPTKAEQPRKAPPANLAKVASFSESFNDITLLAGNGWTMTNASVAVGSTNWFQGNPVSAGGPFDSHSGAPNAYIGANYNNTGSTGTISNWLITPLLDFGNAASFTFWTRKPAPDTYADRLQIRLSVNGGSGNVGTGTGVGDFTTLLLEINPTQVLGVYPTAWTQYTIDHTNAPALPHAGTGRIALRYFVTNAGLSGSASDYIGIDDVAFSAGPAEHTVGGTVTGLVGSGLALSLNGGAPLAIGADGAFQFPGHTLVGTEYTVTVQSQPGTPAQTCTIAGGVGIVTANVSNIGVTCTTNTYSIGGNVGGLAGSGLVLQLNGGDDLPIAANGAFSFAGELADLSDYTVSVLSQPDALSQTCTLANATGTLAASDVTNVQVTCVTDVFTIGGTVSGLVGSGLVLVLNGDSMLPIAADGAYTFAGGLPDGSDYSVTIGTAPGTPTQTCAVANASGTVAGGDVGNVDVSCVTDTYAVGGTVTGLAGSGLVLQLNGGGDLAIGADGAFAFPAELTDGSNYAVTVLSQPATPSQTCTLANAAGTIASADVGDVAVTCSTNTFAIGGSVSGLAGSGLVLQLNSGADLPIAAAGAFAFPGELLDGSDFNVTVLTQPGSPTQTCSVAGGSGTLAGADVTTVAITCATETYAISGAVSGLVGSGLALQLNGGAALAIAANGAFAFPGEVADGSNYAVTVQTAPSAPSQTCVVGNGNGVVAGADIGNVTVTCSTDTFSIGGNVSGLTGTGLVLQLNGGGNLAIAANGAFTFPNELADGSDYSVSVSTQPSGPSQVCSVTAGSGTLAGADIANVAVVCAGNEFSVGGNVSGLSGSGLTLLLNGGNALAIAANGAFTFATPIADGANYAVSVQTQPGSPDQTCTVSNASGTMDGAPVTNVAVVCATDTYSVGGSVSGLAGSGLVLQLNGAGNLAVAANGAFVFPNELADGSNYAVTVLTQPGSPAQTCTVTAGSGTLAGADVSNVAVACTTAQRTVTVQVDGAMGSVSPAGAQVVADGGSLVLTLTPNAGFVLLGASGCGGTLAGNVFTIDPVTQNCAVVVSFGAIVNAGVIAVPAVDRFNLALLAALMGLLAVVAIRRR